MITSDQSLWAPSFSHIYVEDAAENYPLAQQILRRFSNAQRIRIKNYKEVFARARQQFQLQKKSLKLILAIKKDNFLYDGSNQSQSFGYRNFYYNALMLNCVYNCDYCYLQGMYASANIVVFVNIDDFFAATWSAVAERVHVGEPLYLCVSYDTDLLAFESVAPFSAHWIEFTRTCPDLVIEVRTKSAHYSAIRHLSPIPQVILAWSLSPGEVAEAYEKGAPPVSKRLESIKEALEDGWQVRLCFDPVLRVQDWKNKYNGFVEQTFAELPAERIYDVSLGVFRMNASYFHRIKKQREDSDILYHPYEVRDEQVTYCSSDQQEMMESICKTLSRYLPKEKISVWERPSNTFGKSCCDGKNSLPQRHKDSKEHKRAL